MINSNEFQAKSHQDGFTLVEMMVTIAIMGILASIAVPNFTKQLAQKRTQQGAMDIINVVAQARTNAALSNKSATITVANTNLNYSVSFVDQANRAATKTTNIYNLNSSLVVDTNISSVIQANASGGISQNLYFRVCDSTLGISGYTVWINTHGIAKFQQGRVSGLDPKNSDVDVITNKVC